VSRGEKLANIKRKFRFLPTLKLATTQKPTDNSNKRGISKGGSGKQFSKKGKATIGVMLIAVVLVSCFVFYPKANTIAPPINNDPTATPNATLDTTTDPTATVNNPTIKPPEHYDPIPPPIIPLDESHKIIKNNNLTKETWKRVGEYAWAYFQPGSGVDSNTGLPGSGPWCPYFTDWDIGVYVQAVLDAQAIDLIGTGGTWGANDRLEKVVTFLENRELNATTTYPYWFYQGNGANYAPESDKATEPVNVADTGRLLVALNNTRTYAAKNDPTLVTRINNVVYNTYGNRSNYAALVPSLKGESTYSTSLYAYYIIAGFAGFWPKELADAQTSIINNIINSGTVTTPENITLPKSRLTGDPLFGAIFDLTNNPPQLTTIAKQMYLAHEAFYTQTGMYRAFSEGPTGSTDWAYEWVVYDDKTWVVRTGDGDYNITPIIYSKIAFSFLAVYNSTYARDMVIFLEDRLEKPDRGYYNGINEAGTPLADSGIHTDGLILGACKYAIQHYPTP
jgi:hypothetical protein